MLNNKTWQERMLTKHPDEQTLLLSRERVWEQLSGKLQKKEKRPSAFIWLAAACMIGVVVVMLLPMNTVPANELATGVSFIKNPDQPAAGSDSKIAFIETRSKIVIDPDGRAKRLPAQQRLNAHIDTIQILDPEQDMEIKNGQIVKYMEPDSFAQTALSGMVPAPTEKMLSKNYFLDVMQRKADHKQKDDKKLLRHYQTDPFIKKAIVTDPQDTLRIFSSEN